MHDDGQHVGGGAYIVTEETCLHLRAGEYGGRIRSVGRGNGECWLDNRIWRARL